MTIFTFAVGAVSNHARFFNVAPDSGIRWLRLPKKMRARLGKQVTGHARAQDFCPMEERVTGGLAVPHPYPTNSQAVRQDRAIIVPECVRHNKINELR
jgi:hypothetical protein